MCCVLWKGGMSECTRWDGEEGEEDSSTYLTEAQGSRTEGVRMGVEERRRRVFYISLFECGARTSGIWLRCNESRRATRTIRQQYIIRK